MQIDRSQTMPSQPQPANAIMGQARRDGDFRSLVHGHIVGATVTFEPGARTAWHTHPLGQILLIASGVGWVQSEGGAKQTVVPGDIVRFGPGERHWHGATDRVAMSHIAIVEELDGVSTDWQEHVTDAEYLG